MPREAPAASPDAESSTNQFSVTSSKLYGDALVHDKPELSGLVDLHALVSLMGVNSSAPVIESAVEVVRVTTETYSQAKRSNGELGAMIASGSLDLLRPFSAACRTEVQTSL
jgi:hypothetical protein